MDDIELKKKQSFIKIILGVRVISQRFYDTRNIRKNVPTRPVVTSVPNDTHQ